MFGLNVDYQAGTAVKAASDDAINKKAEIFPRFSPAIYGYR
jgi:hypothetical protein